MASNHQERLVKEAMYIRLSAPGVRLNRDEREGDLTHLTGPLEEAQMPERLAMQTDAEYR